MIGTVAFASSGALTAMERDMDFLGIHVLAVVTAVGGGMLRDIMIGSIPPALFVHPVYVLVAMATASLIFLVSKYAIPFWEGYRSRYEAVMQLFDAVGLAAFTISGMNTAILKGYGENGFLLLTVGVLTGTGGGVLRDILANNRPYIFVKHIYACASVAGAAVFLVLYKRADSVAAGVFGMAAIVLIRVLAIRYKWNLPRVRNLKLEKACKNKEESG